MRGKNPAVCLLLVPLLASTFMLPITARTWPPLQKYREDIEAHRGAADNIIDYILTGSGEGQVYKRLANMVDKFGPRLCGSQTLEASIDYMIDEFKSLGFDNVHKEPVSVPHWIRGEERAELLIPRRKPLALLGLGRSVSTPREGITADAIVVRDFDELRARASEAKGKIVVYNQIWQNYDQSVQYRTSGASEAAKVGGVAALIRSAASFSIYSPHTGTLSYEEGVERVPGACITVEDAELMWRMSQRGEQIRIHLFMDDQTLENVESFNVIGEIEGQLYPNETVLVSGHLDSWDVGQGAMDDGGGLYISLEALAVIRQLGLKPKRTLRVVAWTCEEFGGYGGQEYFKIHQGEAESMDIVMESDSGTFTPHGLQFTGSDEAMKIMQELAKTLLVRLNATTVESGAGLSDVFDWPTVGVPGASILEGDYERYFYFHHSNGDTMTVQNPKEMDLCTAVWAVTAFTIADLENMLPANRTTIRGL